MHQAHNRFPYTERQSVGRCEYTPCSFHPKLIWVPLLMEECSVWGAILLRMRVCCALKHPCGS